MKRSREASIVLPARNLEIGDPEERLLRDFPDAVLIFVDGKSVFANSAMAELLRADEEASILGIPVDNLIRRHDLATPDSTAYPAATMRCGDGSERTVETLLCPVSYRGLAAEMAVVRDVTARVEAERELRVALSLQLATYEATTDALLVVDREGNVVSFNRKFAELAGTTISAIEEGSLDGSLPRLLALVRDPEAFVARLLEVMRTPDLESFDVIEFRDGQVWERHSRPQQVDGETVGIVWSFKDVSESRRLQGELAYQANHDPLTGLLNRRGFGQAVETELALSAANGTSGALIVADLDHFKEINDSHGHLVGDQVLTDVVAVLNNNLPDGTAVGRLGGDEFAVLLTNTNAADAETVARRILDAARNHAFSIGSRRKRTVTLSAGLVLYPQDGTDVEQVMSRVDLALYNAKEQGRDRTIAYASAKRRAESKAA